MPRVAPFLHPELLRAGPSKKARGRAQQTKAHRKAKTRR